MNNADLYGQTTTTARLQVVATDNPTLDISSEFNSCSKPKPHVDLPLNWSSFHPSKHFTWCKAIYRRIDLFQEAALPSEQANPKPYSKPKHRTHRGLARAAACLLPPLAVTSWRLPEFRPTTAATIDQPLMGPRKITFSIFWVRGCLRNGRQNTKYWPRLGSAFDGLLVVDSYILWSSSKIHQANNRGTRDAQWKRFWFKNNYNFKFHFLVDFYL